MQKGIVMNKFQKAADWLKNNTAKNSIIFHSDWGEFPLLFYYNSDNFYINGLDPTFMYEYNEDLYWQWHDITVGKKREGLYPVIKDNFNSSYVFLQKPHWEMSNNFKRDKR